MNNVNVEGSEIFFESPRLILRRFKSTDLEAFLSYRSDLEVARLQGWQEPYTRQMAEGFIEEMAGLKPGIPGEWFQIALEEKSSGEMIGDIAYKILASDDKQAEIGLTLARKFQASGFGLEAVQSLLVFLFEDLKLHRVMATTDVLNSPANNLLERLGFRREAHFIENLWFKGRWSSEYWYAMLGREWKDKHA